MVLGWLFGKKARKEPVPFEAQLRTFAECGIVPSDGITAEMLLNEWGREAFEKEPFLSLAVALGGEEQDLDWRPRSSSLWHFDMEYIDDPSSYRRIAERMTSLTQGELRLSNVESYTAWEDAGDATTEAWLQFEIGGRRYRWDLEVQDDWVDPNVLSRFVELTVEHGTRGRFTILDLRGQDCLIGYYAPEQLATLCRRTGLQFELLR